MNHCLDKRFPIQHRILGYLSGPSISLIVRKELMQSIIYSEKQRNSSQLILVKNSGPPARFQIGPLISRETKKTRALRVGQFPRCRNTQHHPYCRSSQLRLHYRIAEAFLSFRNEQLICHYHTIT